MAGPARSCSGRSSAWASPALIGIGFYKGSRRINLATFFRWTGVALVFIAAGLLSHAVHEFIEIGLINVGTQTLFDISAILPHEGDGSVLGQMLNALFGYTSTPEVATFAVWLTYVVVVLALFLRPVKRPPAPAPVAPRREPGLIVRTAGSPRDPAARR